MYISRYVDVSVDSVNLIKGLLKLNSDVRFTASNVRDKLESLIATRCIRRNFCDQLVPVVATKEQNKELKEFKLFPMVKLSLLFVL